MKIFDTHFHLAANGDLAATVARAAAAGVDRLLVAGAELGCAEAALAQVQPFPGVYAAVGVHPHEAEQCPDDLEPYRRLAAVEKVRAIGEIGLDYYYEHSPRERQRQVFRQFLLLARESGLPAIVHCREAYDDCIAMLEEVLVGEHPFVVHCYSGTPEWAKRFLALGAYISFTGLITFNKADNVRAALRGVPLDRVMFETDSPYLAPTPHRGKPNEPAYMIHIIERAASEYGLEVQEMIDLSTANALRFFGLQDNAAE